MKYVGLSQIIKDMDLEIAHLSTDMDDIKIFSPEISRPGLQIAGFYDKFVPERIQILGSAEYQYLNSLSPKSRYEKIEEFLKHPISVLVVCKELEVFDEIILLAKKYNRTILKSKETTSKLINKVISYIDIKIAPETTIHGVFVEIYGLGVLITGKSGVGKSETALDLVIRGHRLISDDIVLIKKLDGRLRGQSPELTRHFMEIRGLGIIDIERLYGVGSIKNFENIHLVTELELWDSSREYERLGLDEEFTSILDLKIPKVVIPVKPGRNVAMIIEVATRNFRQKLLGYNAAKELNKRIIDEGIKKQSRKQ